MELLEQYGCRPSEVTPGQFSALSTPERQEPPAIAGRLPPVAPLPATRSAPQLARSRTPAGPARSSAARSISFGPARTTRAQEFILHQDEDEYQEDDDEEESRLKIFFGCPGADYIKEIFNVAAFFVKMAQVN